MKCFFIPSILDLLQKDSNSRLTAFCTSQPCNSIIKPTKAEKSWRTLHTTGNLLNLYAY